MYGQQNIKLLVKYTRIAKLQSTVQPLGCIVLGLYYFVLYYIILHYVILYYIV